MSKEALDDAPRKLEEYPCECPACGKQTGVPKSAGTIVGEPHKIRLSMHCPSCDHNWTHDKLTEKPF